jgi:hypothetical protein
VPENVGGYNPRAEKNILNYLKTWDDTIVTVLPVYLYDEPA